MASSAAVPVEHSVILRASNVALHFTPTAGLFGVDMEVCRGDVYGLVGRNGAGKSTLLSVIAGLVIPTTGSVDLAGTPRMAVCPDVPRFEPWLTAEEVVRQSRTLALGRDGYGVDGNTIARRALADVDLVGAGDRRIGRFSRGMTQRLGVAAALVTDPDIVFLDEPASGLDPIGRQDLLSLVLRLRGRCSVVFSSHVLGDVDRVASKIGVLEGGRMVYEGSPEAFVDAWTPQLWDIDVRRGADDLVSALSACAWVVDLTRLGEARVRVRVDDRAAAEVGLARVVANSGCALAGIRQPSGDLDVAFAEMLAHRDGGERQAVLPRTPVVRTR